MDFSEFVKIVEVIKKEHPFWFEDESDRPADDDKISNVEKELKVKLPNEYIEFVKRYGGGYFAFTNVLSVEPNSEWNIVKRNKGIKLNPNFVAVSDDETGGYYGFLIESDSCGSKIFYWDHDSQEILKNPQFEDLFSFLIENGLKKKIG